MSAGAQAAAPVESNHAFADVDNKKLAMWLFLGSDAMSFTGLLGAYAVLRVSAEGAGRWVPVVNGETLALPQGLTAVNTANAATQARS